MKMKYEEVCDELRREPRRWLITGAAGFIGSALADALLRLDQTVIGLDNLAFGQRSRINKILSGLAPASQSKFSFFEADARDTALLKETLVAGDLVLHQAAISSVQLSHEKPAETFSNNTESLISVFDAAIGRSASKVVYASSAAVYGNPETIPANESCELKPISLYGLSKKVNEETAQLMGKSISVVGLRYFNVYGKGQNPDDPYAGVITKFLRLLRSGEPLSIFGDGNQTRDFVHVSDIVRANIMAALAPTEPGHIVCNAGTGVETSVIKLVDLLKNLLKSADRPPEQPTVAFLPAKPGDIRRSVAETEHPLHTIGFKSQIALTEGLKSLAINSD